jgi:hypothetical protein
VKKVSLARSGKRRLCVEVKEFIVKKSAKCIAGGLAFLATPVIALVVSMVLVIGWKVLLFAALLIAAACVVGWMMSRGVDLLEEGSRLLSEERQEKATQEPKQ